MKLGIVTTLPSTTAAVETARTAEALWFDRIAVSDTAPLLYHACYPAVTAILLQTTRIGVGPYVTNPVSRHWSVHLANARAFEELAPGRFFLGIGTGDGAVHSVGLKPATLAEFRVAARELRDRLPSSTPIHMTFSGPKGLALAGEIASEVTIGTGLDAGALQSLARHARAARQQAGIAAPLEIWLPVPVYLAESSTEVPALRAAAGGMASLAARFAFSVSTEGKNVPERLQPAIRRMLEAYEFAHHAKATDNPNAALFDAQPEVRDYIIDRFALVGTPEHCAERLATIAREAELDGFWLMPAAPSGTAEERQRKLALAAETFMPLRRIDNRQTSQPISGSGY
jgi:alkanesulfonate monooxygenase SsuD/methylene tetrahydromethanopterin reductase-like flavin-dependent oxidoreductase (luciferase family)